MMVWHWIYYKNENAWDARPDIQDYKNSAHIRLFFYIEKKNLFN